MNNYSDKFGYYSIGDYCTYSKLEAIELHQKLNMHPKWHFNDCVFGNFDWIIGWDDGGMSRLGRGGGDATSSFGSEGEREDDGGIGRDL